MALFSRRKSPGGAGPHNQAAASEPNEPDPAGLPDLAEEPAATVSVPVPAFGAEGQPLTKPPAPAIDESIPGFVDNVPLRDALAALSDTSDAGATMNVARQLLQGHVFLRVRGDAGSLIADGQPLPLLTATVDERTLVLAFSCSAALRASVRADNETATSAVGQPVLAVIRHTLDGEFGGIILDHASAPARIVLPRQLLERMIGEADEQLTIKTLLCAPRTQQTTAAVVQALGSAPVWVAVNRVDGEGPVGVAEARTPQGERFLQLYSHPLEVAAAGRNDRPAPVTADQLARSLRADRGLTGVVVDPAGPRIRINRDELAPLIQAG